MAKGKLIVVEGIDGSGKSTLVDYIEKQLINKEIPLLRVKEPGSTPEGELLRNLLLDHQSNISNWTEVSILLAAKSQLFADKVFPALNKGINVLMDRFNHSLLAYQGGVRKLNSNDLVSILNIMGLNVVPDLLIYLNIDKQTQVRRLGDIKDRMDIVAMHNYDILNRGYKLADQLLESKSRINIDGGQHLETVYQQAMGVINPIIKKEQDVDIA